MGVPGDRLCSGVVFRRSVAGAIVVVVSAVSVCPVFWSLRNMCGSGVNSGCAAGSVSVAPPVVTPSCVRLRLVWCVVCVTGSWVCVLVNIADF